MEDLAWLFPAEPVERAAVRFCEAIAKWRGKPELETVRSFFVLKTSLTQCMTVQETQSNIHLHRLSDNSRRFIANYVISRTFKPSYSYHGQFHAHWVSQKNLAQTIHRHVLHTTFSLPRKPLES